jgi:hypothetical protein
MVSTKGLETILIELRTFLRAYNRSLSTGDNSFIKDLLLTPYSVGAQAILDQVSIAKDLHLLSQVVGSDLDNEGTNYKKERLAGKYAYTTLYFYTSVAPVADVVIPISTQAKTSETPMISPVSFSTIANATFAFSSAASYFSYDRNRYEFPVLAICDLIGTQGNIGNGYINKIVSSVPGVQGVTNLYAATGGQDEESDDDFRERIRLATTGRDLNVINGLRGYIRGYNFTDAYPVRVEDSDAERYDGIDVFVISPQYTSVTETFTYYAATPHYNLANRPVNAVTSVVGSTMGVTSEYDAYIDNTNQYRRSIYADDYLEIRAAALWPEGETFTVTYSYSESIVNMQSEIDQDDNKILTANVVVKRAYPLSLMMTATLTLMANADGPATRSKVRNALAQFLSEYRMGLNIQKSDLIVVMQTGYGDYPVNTVDAVILNSADYWLVDEFGTTYLPVSETIEVSNKQYVVYGTINIL